jgi:Tfp pilus assembly protein PilF
MANPVSDRLSGASRHSRRLACALTMAIGSILCGCSFDLGSLTTAPENTAAPRAAPATTNVAEAEAATIRAQGLARSGKTKEALAEFDHALESDPNNAQALYGRGLLYQGEKLHQSAIADFSAANGLRPQQPEPLLGRATSYLVLNRIKEAIADLDEAVQAEPQNGEIWAARGLAYERLGDKTKAAESYSRAINLRPKDEAARSGFARVGGKPG